MMKFYPDLYEVIGKTNNDSYFVEPKTGMKVLKTNKITGKKLKVYVKDNKIYYMEIQEEWLEKEFLKLQNEQKSNF